MPHKHTRSRVARDPSSFDLPPTSVAKSLPAGKLPQKPNKGKKKRAKASKFSKPDAYGADDTPKEFARLMQLSSGKRKLDGLDNGDKPRGKKRKTAQSEIIQSRNAESVEIPQIRPGERLSDFAARVNQTLPVSGLARKGKSVPGLKERQTKTERRLQKMVAGWKKEDERLREKAEEERELAEEEEDERDAMFEDKTVDFAKKGKKGKRRLLIGEATDDDEDPWEVLKATREQPKGLHDVVREPPQLKNIPRERFKVRNGATVEVSNVPNAAGSLRRREKLGETRRSVIESYRKLMGDKRGNL